MVQGTKEGCNRGRGFTAASYMAADMPRPLFQPSLGGPRFAQFQLTRSPLLHDLKIGLTSTIPRFSMIFQKRITDLARKQE